MDWWKVQQEASKKRIFSLLTVGSILLIPKIFFPTSIEVYGTGLFFSNVMLVLLWSYQMIVELKNLKKVKGQLSRLAKDEVGIEDVSWRRKNVVTLVKAFFVIAFWVIFFLVGRIV